ncbi:MAG: SGNH/GDSL hydrolase family protein [bacterium]
MSKAVGQTRRYADILLVLFSVFIAFILAESILRLRMDQPVFAWVNYSESIVNCASSFDAEVGWKPEPGTTGTNWEHRPVSITDYGFRSNGDVPVESDQRILAVGDSYTFGAQVGDHESWPAILERRLQTSVINGGVCGYGVGQTVLRAHELVPQYMPEKIIIGITPANIWRSQLSVFYSSDKPYFTLENSVPALRNAPLEPGGVSSGFARLELAGMENIYNYSLFARMTPDILRGLKLYPQRNSVEMHQDGLEVSCLLIARAMGMAERYGAEPYLLLQYTYQDILNRVAIGNGTTPDQTNRDVEFLRKSLQLAECSKEAGIPVIDTFIPMEELYKKDGADAVGSLYVDHRKHPVQTHLNASGNEFVANYIAQQLEDTVNQGVRKVHSTADEAVVF